MRKVLLILALIVGLAVASLAVFLATFDADRYRPLLVNQLQSALGRPVQLQRMTLGWRNGIAVQLQGFAIPDADAGQEPVVQVDSVSAVVRLLPLLRKEVQVSSLIITHPAIHATRDAQGRVNLLGLAVVGAPAAAPSRTTVGNTPVSFQIASLRVERGAIHWTDAMVQPPADLRVNALDATVEHIALGRPMDVDLTAAFGSEQQNVQVRGRLTLPGPTTSGALDALKLTVTDLSLDHLLPAPSSGQPQLRGKLTASLEGTLPTLDASQVAHALSGSGTFKLVDLRVMNLNMLRSVFEKLSILPGLVQQLEARLPEHYQAKLAARDTIFSPVEFSMQVRHGAAQFEHLRVSTDTFHLIGSGMVGVDGTVNIRSTFSIEPELSAAMIGGVRELQALSNQSGELELPVTIQGQAPQIAVLPDMHYVASKVVVTKAADLLERFLQKGEPKGEPTTPDQQRQTQTPQYTDLLSQVIERALKKHRHAESQPQP